MSFVYNYKKLKDYFVNNKVYLYYKGMLFFFPKYRGKNSNIILEKKIEVDWSRFYSIISYRGKNSIGLEIL